MSALKWLGFESRSVELFESIYSRYAYEQFGGPSTIILAPAQPQAFSASYSNEANSLLYQFCNKIFRIF